MSNPLSRLLGGLVDLGASGAGGPSYSAEALAIFAAFSTPPDATRKGLIDTCVVSLKNAGVWAKLDVLYMFAAADSQAAKINWKNPGTFDGTEISGPITFTADQGFTFNGSSNYISSGFVPSSAGGTYALNNASMGGRSLSSLAASTKNRIVGNVAGTSSRSVLTPRNTGDIGNVLINDTGGSNWGNATTLGHYAAFRDGSGNRGWYIDGYRNTVVSFVATALPTTAVTFGADPVSPQFSNLQLASGFIGGFLTEAEAADFHQAELAYMAGVGAVAYESETTTLVAAFSNAPTTARKNLINATIKTLKSSGIWAKMDAFYVFAAADSQAALINWKSPGTFDATTVNSPTFTADRGFTGSGSAYVRSHFTPSTAGGVFTQNSAHISVRSLTAGVTGRPVGGISASAQRAVIILNNGSPPQAALNDNSFSATLAGSTTNLHFTFTRTASNAREGVANGATAGTDTTASVAVCDQELTFAQDNGASFALQIASGSFGSGLDINSAYSRYIADNTYMRAVGAV